MYSMKYDHVYPNFQISPISPMLPCQLPNFSFSSSSLFSSLSLFFDNSLCTVHAAYMCMGVGPSTATWETYQRPPHQQRMVFPPPAVINCQSAPEEGVSPESVSHILTIILTVSILRRSCNYTCYEFVSVIAISHSEGSVPKYSSTPSSSYLRSAFSSKKFPKPWRRGVCNKDVLFRAEYLVFYS